MNLNFGPHNPVPLLPSIESTYAWAKEHSAQVDQHFGFHIAEIEKNLLSATQNLASESPFNPSPRFDLSRSPDFDSNQTARKEAWIGLDPASLQTPYTELRFMLSKLNLKPGQTLVDLGAAYGRIGIVMGLHYPESHFIGLEIVSERAAEGARVLNQHGFTKCQLFTSDVCIPEVRLPQADAYFIYDLSSREKIVILLEKIKERARTRSVCVVGRGRATRDRIEKHEPWLSEIVAPVHYGNFSIYRNAE